ncbi:myosin-9-like isoform X2 [Leptidea sinapis]|uniref:myosin-9-like isoform X2 n=1 Tax=Leptidea sinapis TaxID=189913 RepID=UPI0021C36B14|nr:myosin-9-like isoform X2 [Leptidea sinapis]
MSESALVTVKEMIEMAFGETETNMVNFKLIQTILFLIARQLRLLERRVEVQIGPTYMHPSSSSLSVTEVKLKAAVPKIKKRISKSQKQTADPKQQQITDPKVEQTYKKPQQKPTIAKGMFKPGHMQAGGGKSTDDRESSDSDGTISEISTEMSTTDKTILSKVRPATTASTEMTSKEKTSAIKTADKSPSIRTSIDKTADKSPSIRTSIDKTAEKSPPIRTSIDKSADKSATEITTIDKPTTDKTITETSLSLKTQTTETSSTKKIQPTSIRSSSNAENKRKMRANSQEQADKSPTPMASIDTMEVQYEKLLIVERVPSDEAKERENSRAARYSVVTQEQFDELSKAVRDIQEKFMPIGKAELPENMQLMKELRRGASLTDAMAALQLSARLEAAETSLQRIMGLITTLAASQEKNRELETGGIEKEKSKRRGVKKATSRSLPIKSSASLKTYDLTGEENEGEHIKETDEHVTDEDVPQVVPPNLITYEDLDQAMQELQDSILLTVNCKAAKTAENAESALKTAKNLENKLEGAIRLEDRMNQVEELVAQYVEEINKMDMTLASQMTNYQEELTQMEHDLEMGLEALAEALANTGGDSTAAAELNANFIELQAEFDYSNKRQNELKETQTYLALDLQALWKQIEILRESKSDRDEVADALRDKAGLGALNGLVSLQQFNAVRGDFEKRIGAAYDKFNSQEMIWQKAIDDLLRELDEKGDLAQVIALRDEIYCHIQKLNAKCTAMQEILGEPNAAAISRAIIRDANCLSCSSPANLSSNAESGIPALPEFPKSKRPPTIGAEVKSGPKEDGDHICYPGQPITHTIDPRAHFCHRYCGGAHTMGQGKISRAPIGTNITALQSNKSTAIGTDGRVYVVDEDTGERKPCLPCNQRPSNATNVCSCAPQEADEAPNGPSMDGNAAWDMTEFQAYYVMKVQSDSTPPMPIDSDE